MEQVGRYRIEKCIGEGAMAHVYLAHDPSIDRPVAIKVLKTEFRVNDEIVRRFLSESRAAGMLSHANIVTIFDVGEADGAPYIAMERLNGRPLDELLAEQGRMPSGRVARLGAQIADALAVAHEQGVVHRDIKPSNILICEGGETAKILDFGIARVDCRDVSEAAQAAQRTQAGQVLGTPRYMSPEQALGMPVDARSDLFSLGVVLYEMVTGSPAFSGKSIATLAIQIAQEQPVPIEGQAPDCSKGLRFVISKLLAKKPEARFASARELLIALTREADGEAAENASAKRNFMLRCKIPVLVSGLALLLLGGGVATVVSLENQVMAGLALTSGSSMTSFVSRNAALRLVDNAGLPAAQQDWASLQAFAETAATDDNIRYLVIADDRGLVRASSDPALVGQKYRRSSGEKTLSSSGDVTLSQTSGGFRFVQSIRYAGADFGKVDVVLSRAPLDAAQNRFILVLTGFFVLATLALLSFTAMGAHLLFRPLRRLRKAMDDVAAGNFAFRISHNRKDEIGALFDSMNRMVASVSDRHEDVESALLNAEKAMQLTRIELQKPSPSKAA